MQNRCKTKVVRMYRKKCLTGAPFCPLVLPKVDKWRPNMLQKSSQWHQKAVLCTNSFKNCGMCDLHSICNTLTTFATPVNSYFRPLCTTLTRDFAASVSNCVLEPSEMTSLCDFGTPFDTIGPQTVPHGLQNASPNPPENETWDQVVPQCAPDGAQGTPTTSKSHKNAGCLKNGTGLELKIRVSGPLSKNNQLCRFSEPRRSGRSPLGYAAPGRACAWRDKALLPDMS